MTNNNNNQSHLDRARRGFVRGSTTYTCRSCDKLTRSIGRGDCEGVSLCGDCYDAAGMENEHSDGYHIDAPNADCPLCKKAVLA